MKTKVALCFAALFSVSMCVAANPIKLPTKYTLNGCTLTVSFRNSIEKNDKLDNFYASTSCGLRYTMTESFVIPLSIVAAINDQKHITYSCPESARDCIAVVKLFSVKEGGRVCDRADNTANDFQPLPPNTPSESLKRDILAKSDACRGTGSNQPANSRRTAVRAGSGGVARMELVRNGYNVTCGNGTFVMINNDNGMYCHSGAFTGTSAKCSRDPNEVAAHACQ